MDADIEKVLFHPSIAKTGKSAARSLADDHAARVATPVAILRRRGVVVKGRAAGWSDAR